MASSLPIVRQVAWLSIIPQAAVMVSLIAVARALGSDSGAFAGAMTYLALSFALRALVPRQHRAGMKLFKQERFAEAAPLFRQSYDFFSRHPWVDRWRAITMLSSSRISYREMARLNLAFCLAQSGQREQAMDEYRRTLEEFPESAIARVSMNMMKRGATGRAE